MRILKGLLIAFLTLSVTVALVWTFVGSTIVRSALVSAVRKDCPACRFNIGSLHVSLFSGHTAATDVDFQDDPSVETAVDFKIPRMELDLNPTLLFGSPAYIENLKIEHPEVVVRERYSDPPEPSPAYPPAGYATRGLPPFRASGVSIHEGHFTYELGIYGKTARIQVQQIDAKIGPFTTRYALVTPEYEHPVHLHISGTLEHSGNVELDALFDPFAEKNHDRIVVDLTGQNMSELNPYFSVEDGIELSGVLHHGQATMLLSEGVLTGNLETTYENLGIKLHPTPDQGAIKTFLKGAIEDMRLVKTRPRDDKDKPAAPILAKRAPHTPIIKWILKGLKDASDKIVSG